MKFTEHLKSQAAKAIAAGLILSITTSLMALLKRAWYPLVVHVLPAIDVREVIQLNLLLILLNILAWTLLFFRREPQFKVRFGVYWDKNKNPRCASCESPLLTEKPYTLSCKKCDPGIWFILRDESGKQINLADAQKLI